MGVEASTTVIEIDEQVVGLTRRPRPLPERLTDGEKQAHAALVAKLGEKAVWNRYHEKSPEAQIRAS